MSSASYFTDKIKNEGDVENLNDIMNDLNSLIDNISMKREKALTETQKMNLSTELKALKLVFSTGNKKLKELNEIQ